MLLEFRVANFRSFAEEQVFSLVADKDQALTQNTVECAQSPTGRVIRLAVLYGPNGGGKSNLVRAIEVMRRLVVDSARWQDGDPVAGMEPFRLDGALSGSPCRFELTFVADWTDPDDPETTRRIRYQYGFEADVERIHEEWLLAYPHGQPQTWFERSVGGIEFGRHLRGEKKRIESATRPNALFLSVAAQQNQRQLLPVFRLIRRGLSSLGSSKNMEFGDSIMGRVPLSFTYTADILLGLGEGSSLRELLIGMLRNADVGIQDVRVERRQQKIPTNVRHMLESIADVFGEPPHEGEAVLDEIIMAHRARDGATVEWNLRDESDGTQHLFALLGPWVAAMVLGQTAFFDEVFSNLHPVLATALSRDYLRTEINDETPRSQIVLTTHDTNLLDPDLLRRDQIWFVEKNPDGASRLYSLLEYRPRKDENFEKGYLAGRYGALPFIGDLKF